MTPRESLLVSRTTGRIRNTASAMNVTKRSATSTERRRGGSVRRLALGARGLQPVELGRRDAAQRPAGQALARPLARPGAGEADPHLAEHADVALELEPERGPGARRVGNGQFVDAHSHPGTVPAAISSPA